VVCNGVRQGTGESEDGAIGCSEYIYDRGSLRIATEHHLRLRASLRRVLHERSGVIDPIDRA
jgi:hypothetical protein